MKTKRTFQVIFLMLALILAALPLATSLNEGLTKFIERMVWYKALQTYIVPYESRVLAGVISLIPQVEVYANIKGIELNGMQLYVTWNCIGWQSFLLLLVSVAVGFGKKFTFSSQLLAFIFGVCGLFLINVFRLSTTALLAVYLPKVFIVIFHNYLAALLTIAWLIFFWWFSYSFVLELSKK
jgi:exosortase/archaeosortase family protein